MQLHPTPSRASECAQGSGRYGLLGALMLALALGVTACHENTRHAAVGPATTELKKFLQTAASEANQFSFDRSYAGTPLVLSGKVRFVGHSDGGERLVVALDPGFDMNWFVGPLPVIAHFGFPLSQRRRLEGLDSGTPITLRGAFEGLLKRQGQLVYDVILRDSVILSD